MSLHVLNVIYLFSFITRLLKSVKSLFQLNLYKYKSGTHGEVI